MFINRGTIDKVSMKALWKLYHFVSFSLMMSAKEEIQSSSD